MARTGLILARYRLVRDGAWLSPTEQFNLLKALNDAKPIAFRVRDPQPDDYNTYIIQPHRGSRQRHTFLTWRVCRDITQRQVRKVDRRAQSVNFELEDTDDCAIARIVALPELGVMAVEDSTGEGRLAGWSAIKRFEAIVHDSEPGVEFSAELAGSPQDLERAVSTWELDRFTFQARPFNPHPSTPGLLLSDLMEKDGIGNIRGVAVPKAGHHIQAQDEGLVKEALGLAAKGYAVYGAEGRTPSGAEARIKKQQFSFDRNRNMERMRGPQQLRVYVEADEEETMMRKMADVLIDFFVTQSDET